MPIAFSAAGSDAATIVETRAGTMVDNDNNKRRRLVEFKDGCRYGKFGKTKAYELIAHESSTAGELELRVGPGVRCHAVCFTPGRAD